MTTHNPIANKLIKKIETLSPEQIKQVEKFVDTLNKENTTEKKTKIDRQTFLKLPIEERNRILAKQVAEIEEHYTTDSEWQDWVNFDLVYIDEYKS